MKTLKHHQNILTRGLPKTGQVITYAAGDDGVYEAGWWVGRLNANNRVRWIVKTIGGDVVVFDRATGLMWAADGNAAGCNNGAVITWANAIAYCNALNFAGFNDWRLPNVKELMSILAYNLFNPSIEEPPFINTEWSNYPYWSSTTVASVTTSAWIIRFLNGKVSTNNKALEWHLRAVRNGL